MKKKDVTGEIMNLYEIEPIEFKIRKYAQDNDGEVSEELLQELVEAQTKSIESLEELCWYVRHLESFVDMCKSEKNRISDKQTIAENRISGIKKHLIPYVKEKGKIDIGTMTLSTRKSSSVILADDFVDPRFTTVQTVVTHDKNRIKKAIKDGAEIEGAQVITKDNLSIK